jgi:hypothetical protein
MLVFAPEGGEQIPNSFYLEARARLVNLLLALLAIILFIA